MTIGLQKCPSMGARSPNGTVGAPYPLSAYCAIPQRCFLKILMRVSIDMYHQLTYALPVRLSGSTYIYVQKV